MCFILVLWDTLPCNMSLGVLRWKCSGTSALYLTSFVSDSPNWMLDSISSWLAEVCLRDPFANAKQFYFLCISVRSASSSVCVSLYLHQNLTLALTATGHLSVTLKPKPNRKLTSIQSVLYIIIYLTSFQSPQANDKAADGGLMPDANGKDPNPGGQTEGSKWQKPRITRKSLMKCCLVKWIIASTTQQGPGRAT